MSTPEEYPKEETDNPSPNTAISPNTVMSPKEVEEYEKAKVELFINLFHKRETYYKRWFTVTGKHFTCLSRFSIESRKYETDMDDVIKKCDNSTMRRKKEFAGMYHFDLDEDGYFSFLQGLDYLVKPSISE